MRLGCLNLRLCPCSSLLCKVSSCVRFIYMWHDSFIYDMTCKVWSCLTHVHVTWLIRVWDSFTCDMTHSCLTWRATACCVRYHHVSHSFICQMTHLYVTWPIHMWHDSFMYMWCDSFIREMTHSCKARNPSLHCNNGTYYHQLEKKILRTWFECAVLSSSLSTWGRYVMMSESRRLIAARFGEDLCPSSVLKCEVCCNALHVYSSVLQCFLSCCCAVWQRPVLLQCVAVSCSTSQGWPWSAFVLSSRFFSEINAFTVLSLYNKTKNWH